jgi:mannose-6-phosphate isomerase-like protein (cupin superfamily)
MTVQSFITKPDGYQRSLNVLGIGITVLAAQSFTGSHEITLQEGGAGMGPPPHSHGWDESFFVLEGTVDFSCDGRSEVCGPGTLVHVPAGTVHAFSFGSEGGKMLEIAGSTSQATTVFTALDREISPTAPDLEKAKATLEANGVTVHV